MQPVAQTDEDYTVQVVIINSSETTLTVAQATLSAGQWAPDPSSAPVPGTLLKPGGILTYANAAANSFSGVGGSITLTPANGGFVVASWIRQQGGALTVNGSISSDTLMLQFSSINAVTNSPTAQYLITNIGV